MVRQKFYNCCWKGVSSDCCATHDDSGKSGWWVGWWGHTQTSGTSYKYIFSNGIRFLNYPIIFVLLRNFALYYARLETIAIFNVSSKLKLKVKTLFICLNIFNCFIYCFNVINHQKLLSFLNKPLLFPRLFQAGSAIFLNSCPDRSH